MSPRWDDEESKKEDKREHGVFTSEDDDALFADTYNQFTVVAELLEGDISPRQWLVEGVVPLYGRVLLYGPKGSGKSFVCRDLVLGVGTGRPWHGRPTKAAIVLYFDLENSGEERRIRFRGGAAAAGIGPQDVPWSARLVERSINLLDATHLQRLVADIAEVRKVFEKAGRGKLPVLIIIDTLAACMGGSFDENNTSHMSAFVGAIKELNTIATVLITHHSGRNGAHPRGSNALESDVDVVIRVAMTADRQTLTFEKRRGGVAGEQLHFRKEVVTVETTGGPETTIVLRPIAKVEERGRPTTRPDAEGVIREALENAGPEGMTRKELIAATGLPDRTCDRYRKKLADTIVMSGQRYVLADLLNAA